MARPRRKVPSAPPPNEARPAPKVLREKTNTIRPTSQVEYGSDPKDSTKRTKARIHHANKEDIVDEDSRVAPRTGVREHRRSPNPPIDLASSVGPWRKSNGVSPTDLNERNRSIRRPRTDRKEVRANVMANSQKRMEPTGRSQKSAKSGKGSSQRTTTKPDGSPPENPLPRELDVEIADDLELSLSSSSPPASDLNSAKRNSTSMVHAALFSKIHSTPAVESSILALRNFKRRPRQPSMLQMVQQRVASARPSIAQPSDVEPIEDDENLSSDWDRDDDNDDFAPEAEGTPLHVGRMNDTRSFGTRRPHVATPNVSVIRANANKRKSDDFSTHLSNTQLQKRVRLSQRETEESQLHVENSSPLSASPSNPLTTRGHDTAGQDSVILSAEVDGDSLHADIPAHDSLDRGAEQPPNGTMADPTSSSPQSEKAHKVRESVRQSAKTRSMSTRQRKPQQVSNSISTATLQAMLPKRRRAVPKQRPRDAVYNLDPDSEEEILRQTSPQDEDSDADDSSSRPRRPTRSAPTRRGRSTITAKKTQTGKATPSKATERRKAPARNKAVQTYGRDPPTTTSDKENAEESDAFEEAGESTLPDVSLTMHEAAKGRELENARQKFAEVDEWDLEFESVSAENHHSSSPRWR